MGRCFVIQPFDGGPFDKRYDEVIGPAIVTAGLEPYRVDRDPSVMIPVETIEAEISAADACLAEISTDNPNVWYELGYAYAKGKDVVLVRLKECSEKPPFDIQHRSIIFYARDSPADFAKLGEGVTARLAASLTKRSQLVAISSLSPVEQTEGLAPHEIAVLVVLMEKRWTPNDSVSPYQIAQGIDSAGFRTIAANLGLESLKRKDLIDLRDEFDENAQEPYTGYFLTQKGVDWLLNASTESWRE